MSRYIDAGAVITAIAEFNKYEDELEYPYASDDLEEYKDDARLLIEDAPSIDLDDYVPKDFHDKTCEAMAKAHQEEIADMVRVVRCKECDMSEVYQSDSNGVMARYCKAFTPTRMVADDDYCSYGERSSE